METCSNCNTETVGIQECGHVWCPGCGSSIKTQTVYVTGYAQSHSCRTQIYSRRKRFGHYVQSVCHGNFSVLQKYHDILDLYSQCEFCWLRNKQNSQRIYFFAKPVMLQFCCKLLKLSLNHLPSLKDKNREINQHEELDSIHHCDLWKQMYERNIVTI